MVNYSKANMGMDTFGNKRDEIKIYASELEA